jgi:hypothetical protein
VIDEPGTRFRRFVALGDSQTEGVGGDCHPDGTARGWADRFAVDPREPVESDAGPKKAPTSPRGAADISGETLDRPPLGLLPSGETGHGRRVESHDCGDNPILDEEAEDTDDDRRDQDGSGDPRHGPFIGSRRPVLERIGFVRYSIALSRTKAATFVGRPFSATSSSCDEVPLF